MNIHKLVAEATANVLKSMGITSSTPTPETVATPPTRTRGPAQADATANSSGYLSAKQLGYKTWQLRDWEKRYGLRAMTIGCRYYYKKADVDKVAEQSRRATSTPPFAPKVAEPAPVMPPEPAPVAVAAPRAPMRRIVTPPRAPTPTPPTNRLPPGIENWVSIDKVSELTGANPSTVQIWCRKEHIVAHLLNGRAWRIDIDAPKTVEWLDGYKARVSKMQDLIGRRFA